MHLECMLERWEIGWFNKCKNMGIGRNHVLVVVHSANGQQPRQTAQFLAQEQLA